MKKYRSAQIEVVSNGFIINIGCQKVVAETPESLLSWIKSYIEDPDATEERLMKHHLNKCQSPSTLNEPAYDNNLQHQGVSLLSEQRLTGQRIPSENIQGEEND